MVDNWKKGGWPRGDLLLKLSEELRVSADYLLGRVDFPDMHSRESRVLDDRERDLIDSLRMAQEPTRNLVFKISKTALSSDTLVDSTASMPAAFLHPNGQVLAHSSRATRPYPKQVQAASKRTGARVWNGVEGKTAAGPPITTGAADDQRGMVPVKYTGAQYFIVQGEGDSMAGLVEDGAFVVLDRLGHFDDGRIVLVQADGPTDQPEATLKRIFRRPGDRVELRSENPKYPPMFYPAEEVLVMGELVTVLRPDCTDIASK
jgi:SOS-response transcriptional repressor LexA